MKRESGRTLKVGSCESTELEKHFPLFALVVVPAVSREKHVLLQHLLLPLLRNLIFLVFSSVFPSCYPPSLTSSNQNCLLTRRRFKKRLSWLGRGEFKVHWSDSRRQSIIISSDESDHELNSCVKVCNAHRGVNRISLAVIHGQWPLLPSHCGAAGHLTYMYSIYTIIITIAVTFHIHTHRAQQRLMAFALFYLFLFSVFIFHFNKSQLAVSPLMRSSVV